MRLFKKYFKPGRLSHAGIGRRAGVSLVELMIALAILVIGITGLMQSFSFIQKAVQGAKNRTIASNLAQEKMQILKQKTYYQVIITTDPKHNTTDFSPESLDYDIGYFPPEDIKEAGVAYTRYTYIQGVRDDAGALSALGPTSQDTGMKRITVTVVWGYGDRKRKLTIRSILANPDTVMANSVFFGTVKTTGTVAISGALVQVVEASGWSDATNSSGQYNINCTPGFYTLMASATGYYPVMNSVVVAAGGTLQKDFQLSKIATGRIDGYPWRTDHLVISQVVGSTVDIAVTPNFDQEYVEVFNPSTHSWTMNGTGGVGLKFRRSDDTSENAIQIDYVNPTIASGGYYLFANRSIIVAGGDEVVADAVWSNSNSTYYFPYFGAQGNIIPVDEDGGGEGGGAVKLYQVSDGTALDAVGWNKTGHPAPFSEGAAISQTVGLSRNELYARLTSTGDAGGVNWNYGPAYDSNNNNVDFYDYSASIIAPPHGFNSGLKNTISGTPAAGAIVSCTDGFSASTTAVLYANPGPQPYAYFSLVNVATGSWTVSIASGAYSLERSSVPIPNPGSSYTFASTSTFLAQDNLKGTISGRVTNSVGGALSGITVTSGGANSTTTGTDGRYGLKVPPGVVNIVANPSGGSASYVTASSTTIPIEAGELHGGVDFVLYQGGKVRGFVTRDGTSALPGVAVAILDANSIARDQQVSGTDGRFTSVVLSTGYYTVQPAIGALEASSPISSTVTILGMGDSMFSSTFTISGALGYISGTVNSNGAPIQTGVLIVVTTTTLNAINPQPPDLSSGTLTGAPYYMVSSLENGSYITDVRDGSGYNVYAFYPVVGSTGTAARVATGVSVTAGQTTSGVNFSW